MVEAIYVLFILVMLSIFLPDRAKNSKIIYITFFLFFFLIAGFRPIGSDRDYFNYYNYWYYGGGNMEFSFKLIVRLLKDILKLPVQYLFVVFAFFSILLKFVAIPKLTQLKYLTLLLYLSHYFILNDFTQIRAAVASGFFLLAMKPLYDRNFKFFFIIISLAVVFHYSAIVLYFMWFLKNDNKKSLWLYFIVPLGYLFSLFDFNIAVINIPLDYINQKIAIYNELSKSGDTETVNLFNAAYLLRILVYYTILLNKQRIGKNNKYTFLLLKIYALSLFALPALSSLSAVAFRIHELLGIIEIILFPFLIFLFKKGERALSYVFLIGMCVIFLFLNIYYNKLILE